MLVIYGRKWRDMSLDGNKQEDWHRPVFIETNCAYKKVNPTQKFKCLLIYDILCICINHTSRWTRPLVMSRRNREGQIFRKLVIANPTHTWWHGTPTISNDTFQELSRNRLFQWFLEQHDPNVYLWEQETQVTHIVVVYRQTTTRIQEYIMDRGNN